MENDIVENVEPFVYQHEDTPGSRMTIVTDPAAKGLNCIGEIAARENMNVCLSGAGADEVLSDYGRAGEKIYAHSEFGGVFPEDLSTIFPWRKFFGDTQRSYLFKEEFILGRHAIEGRYPFLDKAVVQAFLSLTTEAKNYDYKAPIAYMLEQSRYPYERHVKRGFDPSIKERGWSFARF
ncbi:unnamed protein product, partial [marine sediment metagenome]